MRTIYVVYLHYSFYQSIFVALLKRRPSGEDDLEYQPLPFMLPTNEKAIQSSFSWGSVFTKMSVVWLSTRSRVSASVVCT